MLLHNYFISPPKSDLDRTPLHFPKARCGDRRRDGVELEEGRIKGLIFVRCCCHCRGCCGSLDGELSVAEFGLFCCDS